MAQFAQQFCFDVDFVHFIFFKERKTLTGITGNPGGVRVRSELTPISLYLFFTH